MTREPRLTLDLRCPKEVIRSFAGGGRGLYASSDTGHSKDNVIPTASSESALDHAMPEDLRHFQLQLIELGGQV